MRKYNKSLFSSVNREWNQRLFYRNTLYEATFSLLLFEKGRYFDNLIYPRIEHVLKVICNYNMVTQIILWPLFTETAVNILSFVCFAKHYVNNQCLVNLFINAYNTQCWNIIYNILLMLSFSKLFPVVLYVKKKKKT